MTVVRYVTLLALASTVKAQIGACCDLAAGACVIVADPGLCAGVFVGAGTSCTPDLCPTLCGPSSGCDDFDACTTNSCAPGTCNIGGSSCTLDTQCVPGALCVRFCSNTPIDCDDQDDCTTDTCDPQSGCVHTQIPNCPAVTGACCITGGACILSTSQTCLGIYQRDGTTCGAGDVCPSGACCQTATGTCFDNFSPVNCAAPLTGGVYQGNGVVCTSGLCPSPECTTDVDCDDGVFCNGTEVCDTNGNCQAGTAVDCDDSVACTDDVCAEPAANCINNCRLNCFTECQETGGSEEFCEAFCTDGRCITQCICSSTPNDANCEDDDVCTTDSCNPQNGCLNTPIPGCGCESCALSHGYWKNHQEDFFDAVPQTYDNWICFSEEPLINTIVLMSTPPKGGNAWIRLAYQYYSALADSLSFLTNFCCGVETVCPPDEYFGSAEVLQCFLDARNILKSAFPVPSGDELPECNLSPTLPATTNLTRLNECQQLLDEFVNGVQCTDETLASRRIAAAGTEDPNNRLAPEGSANAEEEGRGGLSTASSAGIAVGVVVAVIAAIALIAMKVGLFKKNQILGE